MVEEEVLMVGKHLDKSIDVVQRVWQAQSPCIDRTYLDQWY